LYRLISPTNGSEFSATETVSPDKSQAVVFAFVHSTREGRSFPRLQLLGLDPKATYALGSIEGKAAERTPAEASGAWWMNHGIEVALRGDFQGAAFRLDRNSVRGKRGCCLHWETARARMKYGRIFVSECEQDLI
jgi:alpha-galactosidase